MTKTMREIFPIPEVLTAGDKWEIVGGDAERAGDRRLVVPLSPDQHDQVVRTHELGHIKWSLPASAVPKDLNPAIYAVVDDARVNGLLTLHEVDLNPGFPEELLAYTIGKLRATKDRWGALMFRVAMSGMPQQEMVDRALSTKVRFDPKEHGEKASLAQDEELLRNMRYWLASEPNTVLTNSQWSVQWTRRFMGHIKNVREEEQQRAQSDRQAATKRSAAEQKADAEFARKQQERAQADNSQHESWLKEMKQQYMHSVPKDERGRPQPFSDWASPHHIPWGKMRMLEPPRSQRMPGRFGRQRRPCDSGTVLAYPSRLWQDAKVFGKKLRGHGGSVLVDGSGSMSLSPDQVWEILRNAPGATIAIYSSERTTADRGVLKILAKKGLVVQQANVCTEGGGNVVDFPALQWLAKQEEPRIWVSDGGVTGVGDLAGTMNRVECFELAHRARILRTQTASAAIDVLTEISNRRMGLAAVAARARKR